MQPPTPYSRTTFPIPSPSRRPRHATSSSNLRSSLTQTSLPRLLAAAAAVTSSRTWVLHDVEGNGGVGLLVLALFAARVYREGMDRSRDRKGKKKEIAGGELFSLTQFLSAAALSMQAITFFSAVKTIGPLRGSLLSIASSILSSLIKNDPGTKQHRFPFLPAILASAFMLFDAHKLHGPECLLNLFTLIALTVFLCGPWSSTLEIKTRSGRSPGTGGRLGRLILTFAVSSICLLSLIYMDILPSPHHMLNLPLHHLVLPVMTATLAAYTPLPFATSYDPKPAARIRSPRDYTIYLLAIVVLQFFALQPIPSVIDVLVLLPLVLSTVYTVPRMSEPIPARTTASKDYRPVSITPSSGRWSYWNVIPAGWKPHFQTILHTDSSRKIFYFLLVNLAYMGVQMGYGVMTNSLGLISDAIHMFFDCLGIGVGLWASVAATWKPDGRFTFGYSRVETLSGFANGLFLILISIFIIFEAIQRIIDPPEMETRQLLLVSSIGLGINLFGMWATGGHHHHGHGHSHGHDHGHGQSHGHVHHKKEDHMHGDHHHNHHDHGHHDHRHEPRESKVPNVALGHTRRRSSGKDAKDISLKSLHHGHDQHAHQPSHANDHGHHHDTGRSDCSHDHHDFHGHNQHEHAHPHEVDDHHDHHDHAHPHSHDHDHAHNHGSHGHSHAHSHNMRGVFLHVMADTLGSVGVIISTIMINLTGWTIFDPIASLFIAVLIMASVVPLVIDSGRVLCLDVGAESDKEIQAALGDLSNVEGLANFSAPRFWPRCEGELVGSIHIQLSLSPSAYDPTRISTPVGNKGHHHAIYANAEKVVGRVEKVLKGKIRGLEELVIQVEGSEERVFCDCMTGG